MFYMDTKQKAETGISYKIRVPESVYYAMTRIAKLEGRTLANVMRLAFNEFVIRKTDNK